MPYFQCVVASLSGKKQSLIKQAGTTDELIQSFTDNNGYLVSYEIINNSEPNHRLPWKQTCFSKNVVLEFTNIMSLLLSSGNTVASSLQLCRSIGLVQNQSKTKIGRLCDVISEGIVKGEQFFESLKRCGSSFPKLYTALVRIGEKTGTITEIFSRLSIYLNTSRTIKSKIFNALVYPFIVLTAAILGTIALLIFVLPRMVEIFSVFSNDTDITLAENINTMYRSVYIFLGFFSLLFLVIVAALILRKTSKSAAYYIDVLLLKAPFIGAFFTALETQDLFFAMELCERSNINAAESLREAATVVRNNAFAEAVNSVYQEIIKGEKISAAFLRNTIFPEYIGTWLTVGEQTGQARTVFHHIHNYFEQSIETTTSRLLNTLEPALILLVGLIILMLLVQFVLPLFSLYGAVL
jgi:type II secretory pathway component PulF